MAIEYRAADAPSEDGDGAIIGLATPFNKETMIGRAPWGFREKVAPGAFTKTLKEADTVYLVNHETGMPVARKSAGTLELRQSDRGLEYVARPTADTSYIRDLRENIRAGNISGCSFGFEVVKDEWGTDADGVDTRTLLEVKLPEISAVTFPAYGGTEIGLRDAVSAAQEVRYDRFVRAKYSAEQKKELLAKGHAIKNENGDPSFPIDDEEDLRNAIRAVGRGGADHDHIRKYIIGRAKALGLSSLIPDGWSADGSITEKNSAGAPEGRAAKASYSDLHTCGDCGSTGEYGSFCSQCGCSMTNEDNSSQKFCTSCGSKMPASKPARSAEVPESDLRSHDDPPKPDSSTSDSDNRRRNAALMAARMRAAEPLS